MKRKTYRQIMDDGFANRLEQDATTLSDHCEFEAAGMMLRVAKLCRDGDREVALRFMDEAADACLNPSTRMIVTKAAADLRGYHKQVLEGFV